MNGLAIRRCWNYVALLTSTCLGLIVIFALLYMGIDRLGWGMVLTRQETREADFLSLLYFSMGTFFRIGYGDQIPTGWNCLLVGLEALSSYVLELVFLAQVVTATLERFILRQLQAELEEISAVSSRSRYW